MPGIDAFKNVNCANHAIVAQAIQEHDLDLLSHIGVCSYRSTLELIAKHGWLAKEATTIYSETFLDHFSDIIPVDVWPIIVQKLIISNEFTVKHASKIGIIPIIQYQNLTPELIKQLWPHIYFGKPNGSRDYNSIAIGFEKALEIIRNRLEYDEIIRLIESEYKLYCNDLASKGIINNQCSVTKEEIERQLIKRPPGVETLKNDLKKIAEWVYDNISVNKEQELKHLKYARKNGPHNLFHHQQINQEFIERWQNCYTPENQLWTTILTTQELTPEFIITHKDKFPAIDIFKHQRITKKLIHNLTNQWKQITGSFIIAINENKKLTDLEKRNLLTYIKPRVEYEDWNKSINSGRTTINELLKNSPRRESVNDSSIINEYCENKPNYYRTLIKLIITHGWIEAAHQAKADTTITKPEYETFYQEFKDIIDLEIPHTWNALCVCDKNPTKEEIEQIITNKSDNITLGDIKKKIEAYVEWAGTSLGNPQLQVTWLTNAAKNGWLDTISNIYEHKIPQEFIDHWLQNMAWTAGDQIYDYLVRYQNLSQEFIIAHTCEADHMNPTQVLQHQRITKETLQQILQHTNGWNHKLATKEQLKQAIHNNTRLSMDQMAELTQTIKNHFLKTHPLAPLIQTTQQTINTLTQKGHLVAIGNFINTTPPEPPESKKDTNPGTFKIDPIKLTNPTTYGELWTPAKKETWIGKHFPTTTETIHALTRKLIGTWTTRHFSSCRKTNPKSQTKGNPMKRIAIIALLSAALGANYNKLPDPTTLTTHLQPTTIHEGTLTKVQDDTYEFNDGTTIIIKDGTQGMVPSTPKSNSSKAGEDTTSKPSDNHQQRPRYK